MIEWWVAESIESGPVDVGGVYFRLKASSLVGFWGFTE